MFCLLRNVSPISDVSPCTSTSCSNDQVRTLPIQAIRVDVTAIALVPSYGLPNSTVLLLGPVSPGDNNQKKEETGSRASKAENKKESRKKERALPAFKSLPRLKRKVGSYLAWRPSRG